MRLISVVFPHPEGPISTVKRPSSALKEQSRTTSLESNSSPKAFLTSARMTPRSLPHIFGAMTVASSPLSLPGGNVARKQSDDLGGDESGKADGNHADDALGNGVDFKGLPKQVAQPGSAGDHFGSDDHFPGYPYPHRHPGHDGGDCGGKNDPPKH